MKKLTLTLLCISALFASCDNDDVQSVVDRNFNAKEFIQESKTDLKQEFNLNTSDLPKDITLKEGVIISIPADAFTKNGTPITGNFTLEIYEMLKPSSIIFSGTNTNFAGGRILESDGFIFIDVKQNGQSVDQRVNDFLWISVPTAKDDGSITQLWIGNENTGNNEDQFAWEEPGKEDIAGINNEMRGAWASEGYFKFGLGKLGWINCDVWWGQDKELTTVTVELTGKVGKLASYMAADGDTYVFFCAKGAVVIAQLYTRVNDNTVKSYDDSMPIGVEGKMIAFSVKEGICSFATQDITIERDMKLTLDLKEISKEDLQNRIKQLDGYK